MPCGHASSPGPRGLLEWRESGIEIIRPGRRLWRPDGHGRVVVVGRTATGTRAATAATAAAGPGGADVGLRRGRRLLAHDGIDAEPGGRLFDGQTDAAAARQCGRPVRRLLLSCAAVLHRGRGLWRFVRGGCGRGRGRCGHLPVVQQVQPERYAGQFGGRECGQRHGR